MTNPLTPLFPPGRTFAIGDVHGCANELGSLIEILQVRPQDTVVFLGDYIDRGPDSKGVIERILQLRNRCQVVTLKGNHEAMFLDFLEHPESSGAGLFILNGGAATLASYAGPGETFEIPESHLEFFYSLKNYFETDTHFFVHAGVPIRPLSTLNEEDDELTLLWSRQPFLSSDFKWEKMIVHGHTPVAAPETHLNRINLDTGCVYDGSLTALELPSGKFHQVEKGVKGEGIKVPRDPGGKRVAVRYYGKLPVRASFAGRQKKSTAEFETLNFNQFGVLMKEKVMGPVPLFTEGDVIEGQIGQMTERSIAFRGTVVRVESRGNVRLYGVKIEPAANDSGGGREEGQEGREWIQK